MAMTKKIRFEVFKRDKFTCQYCGASAPDVVLNVDHIHPKSKGGADDITNLITSCYACNQGKKDRTLNDNTVIKKRKKQLDDLQERREQLEMMMDWHQGLIDIEDNTVSELHKFWIKLSRGGALSAKGKSELRKWIKKFDINEILDAMKSSVDQYLVYDNGNMPTSDSLNKAFLYIPRIIKAQKRIKENPYLKDIYYIRGILRNRKLLHGANEWKCVNVMEAAILSGTNIEAIKDAAKCVSYYSQFEKAIRAITINREVKNVY